MTGGTLTPVLRGAYQYWGQILAMTDHDRQFPRGGHITYGEAAGAVRRHGRAARPRLFGFAESQFRLFGRYFRGNMAAPMQRSGSEDLTQ